MINTFEDPTNKMSNDYKQPHILQPVAAPSNARNNFLKVPNIYPPLRHINHLLNLHIPATNSSLFLGLTSSSQTLLSSCHIFSTRLASDDLGGVFHQLIELESKNALANLDVCLGSLSSMNRWSGKPLEYMATILLRISTYSGALIMASKMQMPVFPCTLIPAHTCTSTRYFALKIEDTLLHSIG